MAIDQCGFFELALRYLNTYFSLTEIAFSLHVHLRMLFQDYQTYIFLKCVCYHIKLDDEKKTKTLNKSVEKNTLNKQFGVTSRN